MQVEYILLIGKAVKEVMLPVNEPPCTHFHCPQSVRLPGSEELRYEKEKEPPRGLKSADDDGLIK